MYFDLENLPTQEKYKFLSALVIPRPVAFVTSKNPEGLHNAAPFSFFNMFSSNIVFTNNKDCSLVLKELYSGFN